MLCVLLSVLVVQHSVGVGATMAIPDVATMLYPEFSQRVSFGASSTAALYDASVTDPPAALTACPGDFCMQLVTTSAFDTYPFVLERFETLYSLDAMTFDNLPKDTTLPVVKSSPDGSVKTVWNFSTSFKPYNDTPVISVLLSLKQQTQRLAMKDQLLVHVLAQRPDEYTLTTNIETFSLYGNQLVSHKTRSLANGVVQIALDINRNSSEPDVQPADAFPLMSPLKTYTAQTTWAPATAQCVACTASLLGCAEADVASGACSFLNSQSAMVRCLRETLPMNLTWFQRALQQPVGSTTSIENALTTCFDQLRADPANNPINPRSQRTWWSSLVALNCLASAGCPFGPLNELLPAAPSSTMPMLVMANTTTFVHSVLVKSATFSGYFVLSFNGETGQSNTIDDTMSTDGIRAMLATALAPLTLDRIDVTKEFQANTSSWQIDITYWNLLVPGFTSTFHTADSADAASVLDRPISSSSAAVQTIQLNTTKLHRVDRCDACDSYWDSCQDIEDCRRTVLPCLITKLEAVDFSLATIDSNAGLQNLSILELVHQCVDIVPSSTWNSIRLGLLCYSSMRCPVGPLTGTERTYVQVQSGRQRFALPGDSSSVVQLELSRQLEGTQLDQSFNDQMSNLWSFLQNTMVNDGGTVTETTHNYETEAGYTEVVLTYDNTLAMTPTITGQDLIMLDNTPVKVSLVYAGGATPSLAHLLAALRERTAPFLPTGPPPTTPWHTASECVACNAQLYGCTAAAVASGECYYNSAMSPLGLCFRDTLPSSVFQSMLDGSDSTSVDITTQISRCVNVTLADESTLDKKLRIASTLGCYVATACPFGPLELVQDAEMVVLTTNEVTHVVRIRASAFSLQFAFQFGNHSLISDPINHTMAPDMIRAALERRLPPVINVVVVNIARGSGGTQWNLELRYQNVVFPTFGIAVAPGSDPAPSRIDTFALSATPMLTATARSEKKVSREPFATMPSGLSPTGDDPCVTCMMTYKTKCQASRVCHTVVLPCLIEQLTAFQQTPTPGIIVDITSAVRICTSARNGGPAPFLGWWAPIQGLFGCLATSGCLVSNSANSTIMVINPGQQRFQAISNPGRTPQYTLDVTPPARGSSFNPSMTVPFTGDTTALKALLQYMTQDVPSDISISISGQSVVVTYPVDYLGEIPIIGGQSVWGTTYSQPTVSFQSLPGRSPDWTKLLALLVEDASHPTEALACSLCESTYLYMCYQNALCRNYVLPCLLTGWTYDAPLAQQPATDRILTRALLGCTTGLPLLSAQPISWLLMCYENAQCPLNSDTSATPTYVHSRRGVVRIRKLIGSDVIDATIASPPGSSFSNGQAQQFSGTLDQLRALLSDTTDDTAAVDASVVASSATATSYTDFDLVFSSYYGGLPTIQSQQVVTIKRTASLVTAHSSPGGMVSVTGILNALTQRSSPVSCVNTCAPFLDACLLGNSSAALYCREIMLPCVNDLLVARYPQGSMYDGNYNSRLDLTRDIQVCGQDMSFLAWQPIVNYWSCLASKQCSANTPLSTSVPTFPQVVDGRHVFQFRPGDSLTITIPAPGGMSNRLTFTGGVRDLQDFVQHQVLGGAGQVSVTDTTPPSLNHLVQAQIDYHNYAGELPSFSGDSLAMVSTINPMLGLQGAFGTVTWDQLQNAFSAKVASVQDNRAHGSQCVNQLNSCPVCTATILPTLVASVRFQIGINVDHNTLSADFTSLVLGDVQGVSLSSWRSFGTFVACQMDHGVPASPDWQPISTFVIVQYPTEVLSMPATGITYVVVTLPAAFGLQPRSLYLDASNNYVAFTSAMATTLSTYAGGGSVFVTDAPYAGHDGLKTLTLTYRDYFGDLPVIGGDNVVSLSRSSVRFQFQGLKEQPVWDGFSDGINAFLTANLPPSQLNPTMVPAGDCAACTAQLLECPVTDVSHGRCTFQSPSIGPFISCLLHPISNDLLRAYAGNDVGSRLPIVSYASKCLRSIVEIDQANNAQFMTNDAWYKLSSALACFQASSCLFGPPDVVTGNKMLTLSTNPLSTTWEIQAPSFQARLNFIFGFRSIQSSTFTDAFSSNSLESMLASLVPSGVIVSVDLHDSGDQTWLLTVQVSRLFFDNLRMTLDATPVTVVKKIENVVWAPQLQVSTFNASVVTVVTVDPPPAPPTVAPTPEPDGGMSPPPETMAPPTTAPPLETPAPVETPPPTEPTTAPPTNEPASAPPVSPPATPAPETPAPGPTPNVAATRVLSAHCGSCIMPLFSCASMSDVVAGACTYSNAGSSFMACFRDATSMSDLTTLAAGSVDDTMDVTGTITTCLSSMPTPDTWKTVVQSLGCFQARSCPVGPLDVTTTATTMIKLTTTTFSKHWILKGSPLDAYITVTYSSETRQTLPFTDTETIEDIQNKIALVLYGDVDIAVSFAQDDVNAGWSLTVGISRLFATPFVMTLESPTATIEDLSNEVPWMAQLIVTDLQASTFLNEPSTLPDNQPLVPSGACMSCTAQLLDCSLSDIADGVCTFSSATSDAAQLAQVMVSDITYASILDGSTAEWDLLPRLATYFTSVSNLDDPTKYYKAMQAISCFYVNACPFGPLTSSISASYMVKISLLHTTRQWDVVGAAAFTAQFKFMGLPVLTVEINANTDASSISSALALKLPPNVSPGVQITPMDSTSYRLSVVFSQGYVPSEPNFQLAVLTDGVTVYNGQPDAFATLDRTELNSKTFTVAAAGTELHG